MTGTEETPLDLDFVRANFPTLNSEWVFMDNAGGSLPLGSVIDRAASYLRECPVQLGASYAVSALAQQRLDESSAALAEFVNARDTREILLGPSTSALISRLSRAMLPGLRRGDEIVVTNADHEANISPWMRLAEQGIIIRVWELNRDSLSLEIEDLARLMNQRTRLVCFTHTSNVLGTIVPVAEITRFVHERGAQVCVDGVAYAPHHAIDVQAWNVDYYVFSLYKVYGPHQAVMTIRRDLFEALDNLNHLFIRREDIPYKLQPGGMNYELCYASGAIPEYFAKLGERSGAEATASIRDKTLAASAAMNRHEETIVSPLLEFLRERPGVRIIGETRPDALLRAPTVSFVVKGRDSASIPPETDKHHIAIRWGNFYAPRLIEYLGLTKQNGVVRASLAHYNTREEVHRLLEALDQAI